MPASYLLNLVCWWFGSLVGIRRFGVPEAWNEPDRIVYSSWMKQVELCVKWSVGRNFYSCLLGGDEKYRLFWRNVISLVTVTSTNLTHHVISSGNCWRFGVLGTVNLFLTYLWITLERVLLLEIYCWLSSCHHNRVYGNGKYVIPLLKVYTMWWEQGWSRIILVDLLVI